MALRPPVPPSLPAGIPLPRRCCLAGLLLLLWVTGASGAAALRVAVISDLNSSYGSLRYGQSVDRAVDAVVGLHPDLVISTGDMIAGQRPSPLLRRPQLEAMWAGFDTHVVDPITRAGIPLAATPGNHDASVYPRFSLERAIYREHWDAHRPRLGYLDADHYPFYYAFADRDVLFVSLDVTRPGKLGPVQMRWLRDLLQRQGGRYRYRVLFSHLPLWPFAQQRERDIIGDPALEALLTASKVDLYLSGHHHAFYPGYKAGVAYLSQACQGSGPRRLIGVRKRSPRAIALLEFGADRVGVAALQGPRFARLVAMSELPARIRFEGGEMVRLDLAPAGATDVQLVGEGLRPGR